MRKLLIVAAILFMTPIASAVTAFLSDTGTSVELTVVGGNYETYIAMVIEEPGVLSGFRYGPACPPPGPGIPEPVTVTISGDSGEIWGFPGTCGDGVWLIADWYTTIPVWVSAYETLDLGASWILLDQIQVPEPMTVALLGLGGLFILRRRRHK